MAEMQPGNVPDTLVDAARQAVLDAGLISNGPTIRAVLAGALTQLALREEWGIQSDTGATLKADDRAAAERKATRYSKLRLPGGEAGQTFHVVHRLATDWQRVDAEQQPEDGDRG